MSWKVSPLWCRDLSQQCGSRKWRRVGENNDQRRTGHQSLSCALLPALDVASLLAKQTNAHLDIFFFASDVAAGMMHRLPFINTANYALGELARRRLCKCFFIGLFLPPPRLYTAQAFLRWTHACHGLSLCVHADRKQEHVRFGTLSNKLLEYINPH